MHYRIAFIIVLLLLYPLAVLADGCAYGKGFSRQLLETQQLAVINLTETSADISMFISIEGIPAGKEITYILPFWYRPNEFSLTEEDHDTFWKRDQFQAFEKMDQFRRIAAHTGSKAMLEIAPYLTTGIPSMIYLKYFSRNREKGRGDACSATITPYSTSKTPHARAELYHIEGNDLLQLIAQSGLPEKYRKPLLKYNTPYFAVMRLIGLPHTDDKVHHFHEKGVRYHFTHQLANGRYSYPLGTGAAWPQPIPITEVYLTCPNRFTMQVSAPIEGEQLGWSRFSAQTHGVFKYLTDSSETRKEEFSDSFGTPEDIKELLTPKTASIFGLDVQRAPAWHIAYLQSNPDQDITVQLSKQSFPWRFGIADCFTEPIVPIGACIFLYLLSWVVTARLLIRDKWQQAGSPESLLGHSLATFGKAQLIVPVIAGGTIFMKFAVVDVFASIFQQSYSATLLWAAILTIIIIGGLITALILDARKPTTDWRKWLTLTTWLYSGILFAIMAAGLYGLVYWCETIG